MRLLRAVVVLGTLASGMAAIAQAAAPAPAALSVEDKKGIDATLDAFGPALFRLDFDTFGTLITDDCDWVNIVGMHWTGKAQVVKGHRAIFSTRYKGVAVQETDRAETEVVPGVALVVATERVDDYTAPSGQRMTNNVDRMTWLLVKRDGRWLIRSAHNTPVDAEAAKHDPVQQP